LRLPEAAFEFATAIASHLSIEHSFAADHTSLNRLDQISLAIDQAADPNLNRVL